MMWMFFWTTRDSAELIKAMHQPTWTYSYEERPMTDDQTRTPKPEDPQPEPPTEPGEPPIEDAPADEPTEDKP